MRIRTFLFFFLTLVTLFSSNSQSLVVFSKEGREGIRGADGAIIIPAVYDEIGWSDQSKEFHGDLLGYRQKQRWGLLSQSGKVIVEPTYYRLEPFDETYIKASIKGSFSNRLFQGLMDQRGKVVLSCSYFGIDQLQDLLLLSDYQEGKIKKGLMDRSFQQVAPMKYADIEYLGTDIYAGQLHNGRWSFYTKDGSESVTEVDDFQFEESQLIVKRNSKFGVFSTDDLSVLTAIDYKSIDDMGVPVAFPEWEVKTLALEEHVTLTADSIDVLGELFISHLNGNQHVLNETKEFFENQEVILKYANDGFLISKTKYKERWQLMTTSGQSIIANQDSILFDGMYFSAQLNGSWQVFNRFGRKLTLKKFDEVGTAVASLLPVKRLGAWTLMDFQGNLLSNPRYDSILGGLGNRIAVNYLGSYGVLDAFGQWVVKPTYRDISVLDELILAKSSLGYDILDHSGTLLFSLACEELQVRDGFLAYRKGSNWGMVSLRGTYIADPIYLEVGRVGAFYYGYSQSHVSLFYEDGTQVTDANDGITSILAEREQLHRVVIDGKIGYIDAAARLRIANRYDDGGLISENRLAVKLLGRWGYVDADERLVIQPVYDHASDFEQGVAMVKQNDFYGLIAKDGANILSCEYVEILHHQGGGYIYQSQDGRWGAANASGQVILTPNYDRIVETSNGLLLVDRQGSWGIIDQNGYERAAFSYGKIEQKGDFLLMQKLPEK